MSDSKDLIELPGLIVRVDHVQHQPHMATPPDRPHCFVYYITIHNHSDLSVTIKGRKWVVRDAHNETTVLEGDGVVGQFPALEPGQSFSYNSFHVFDTPSAVATGSYLGVTSTGQPIFTRIPPFEMKVKPTE